MTSDYAMKLLERGEADGIFTSILLLRIGGFLWISFDGKEWEKIDSNLIKKQFRYEY